MNLYKLISPVNKFNYVNIPIIKNNQDYNYQHESTETTTTRKLSVLTKGKKYSDKYLRPKINVIANFMQLEQKTIPAINKRVPEIVQNNSMYFSDPNTKYDELLTATPAMLATVEPYNYFGCRIVGDSGTESTTEGRYLYNFDYGLIFQIIPKDFLARIIDPTLIKESTVYVDSRSAMIMPNKSAFKNIWMDTKTYKPIHPNYVEYIDINNLNSHQPDNLNSVTATNNTYQPDNTNIPQNDESSIRTPVKEEEYKGPFVDVSDEPPILEPDEPDGTLVLPQIEIPPFELPVIDSDNTILDQQQKQPTRRRRKPKNDKI